MKILRNTNPYAEVNWSNTPRVTTSTHMHCLNQETLNSFISQGLELAAISNYYPSMPYYPLSSMRENTVRVRQPGYVKDGIWHTDVLNYNEAIAPWCSELPKASRTQLPFREGKRLFPNVPEGLLEIPNAEHHYFSDASIYLHVTAPGATLSSSMFDLKKEFALAEHGYDFGVRLPWRESFQKLYDSLLTPDGGGIVIAHPSWSHHPISYLEMLLDSDPRILGIEVFNNCSRIDYSDVSEDLWDAILSSGRQCFGFFVVDHPRPNRNWLGRIVLLPEERTAESCLRAMRRGRFYGAISGNGLRFEYIHFDGHMLTAACNRPVEFQLISKIGVINDITFGTKFHFEFPEADREKHTFLRLTAKEGNEIEKLYAQPFILTD